MLSEDRFLLMLNLALTGLLNAVRLRTAKRYQEAMDVIQHTLEEFFGLDIDVLNQVDDTSLLESMRQDGELDLERVAMAADLFREAGILYTTQNRPLEAQTNKVRALYFYLEVVLNSEGEIPEELGEKIEELYAALGIKQVSIETQLSLYYYFDRQGSYREAQTALNELVLNDQLQEEMIEEGLEFYERLLGKSNQELEAGGITRAEVEEGVRRLSRKTRT